MSNGNKNTIYVEANVMNISAKFQLYPAMASEEKMCVCVGGGGATNQI